MGTKKPTIKRKPLDATQIYNIIDIAKAVTKYVDGVNQLPEYVAEGKMISEKKHKMEVGRAINLLHDIRTYWNDASYSDFCCGCVYLVSAMDCEKYNLDIEKVKADLGVADIQNKMKEAMERHACEKTESPDSN